MLDTTLTAQPDTGVATEGQMHYEVAGWAGGPGGCGIECACGTTFDGFDTISEAAKLLDDHIARSAPDTSTATAAQMWAQLGTAVEADNLPTPDSIQVGLSSATIWLHEYVGHDHNNLRTWIAWLGAGELKTSTYVGSPGYMQRSTEAQATWRGWTIRVVLIEAVPIEQVAVAFGGAR